VCRTYVLFHLSVLFTTNFDQKVHVTNKLLSLVFYTIASFIIIQKLKKSHSLPRLEFYSGSSVVCANTHEFADRALATGITQVFPDGHDHNTRAKLQSET
jgi:hypothetical protein